MIVTEVFYGIKCNRCGEMHDNGEYTYWNDESSAMEEAYESDWIEEKSRHYCSNCYEYNEEKDENIPKPDFPKHLLELNKFLKTISGYKHDTKEKEDCFEVVKSINHLFDFKNYQEDYIRKMLGVKLISIDIIAHEKYRRDDCLIKIHK